LTKDESLLRRLKGYPRIFSRFAKLDVTVIAFISFALIDLAWFLSFGVANVWAQH
jgi:hypothetical protein